MGKYNINTAETGNTSEGGGGERGGGGDIFSYMACSEDSLSA